jgi:MFS family permease
MNIFGTAQLYRELSDTEKHNFRSLYLDIAWYGLLSGSAISFITVYLVRIGASAGQIGLMNASPAVIAVFLSIPAGWWLKSRPVDQTVFRLSVLTRMFYLLWVPLPLLFSEDLQVWMIIGLTLLMSVPGTALAVGFNALFAHAVPAEMRGHVVGIRNSLLAATFIATSFLCGYLLENLPFPLNYQIVFLIGFVGAALSSYYLFQVRLPDQPTPPHRRNLRELVLPGAARPLGDALRPAIGLRALTRLGGLRFPRFSILRGPFGLVLVSMFAFHLTQYLAIPLFPIYWVDRLALTDQVISLGNALFYGIVFLGSTQIPRLTERFGNLKLSFVGALMMSAYPAMTSIMTTEWMFLLTSVVGGLAWSVAGAAVGNYLLETIPENERPAHLSWYMLSLNAAVLIGSLGGPWVAQELGIEAALGWIAGGRAVSALGIWIVGQQWLRQQIGSGS